MGFMDEIKKIIHPYDDEDYDYEEEELEQPERFYREAVYREYTALPADTAQAMQALAARAGIRPAGNPALSGSRAAARTATTRW